MGRFELALALPIAGLLGLMIWAAIEDQKSWNAFAAAHECKVVGKQRGSTNVGYGMTSSGQFGTVVVSESDKTGYLCNDGVTYWR